MLMAGALHVQQLAIDGRVCACAVQPTDPYSIAFHRYMLERATDGMPHGRLNTIVVGPLLLPDQLPDSCRPPPILPSTRYLTMSSPGLDVG
jgi:hypothetical protein